ncbi:DUF1156 domain-containing protein [Thermococcus sp. LS2]|uniref:DUF1156 domain-containing protein n=1 Tax=Thermococcus sp. LS2 TaxID=1638260 RepID=UPI00143A9BA9|nr:DUF1156 domain-containing protein [Thermococcus sp. LS2]NJE13750.1 DUF1156 domain-containing protein [Thermococcus sp. LS2]
MDKRFIENPDFPIREVNEKSEKEKGPARPPYWEMVFWWTRKPLIGARAIIAASLLPYDIDPDRFKRAVGLYEKTPHRVNPKIPQDWGKYFNGKKLLDPFAGFGSIPLEGLRIGLDVTAVELLPTAYVFLKAVLDYPKKFGKSLVRDVEKWGNWITEQLKNDPEIKELYDDDVAVYIGTWEVKCPHCEKWTPVIGNYWLARVKDNKGYKRLAYMKPKRTGEGIEIKVIDLNEIVGDVSKAKVEGNKIIIEGKVERVKDAIQRGILDEKDVKFEGNKVIFEVPTANIEARKSQVKCLQCGNWIKYVDEEGRHYLDKKGVKRELEFYVKWALKKYHEGDERFARQRLLVKVKVDGRDLVFEPCSEEDNAKLEKAKEKVKKLLEEKDPDVPREPIPPYGSIGGGLRFMPYGYGMNKWYKLFNPRQLLTLIKIVHLIREVGKRVEEEKLNEGWDKEKAFEYAEAIATYLGIALLKYADYSSVVAGWNQSLIMGHSLSMRGIAMVWNFFEVFPFTKWTGSWMQGVSYTLPKALEYLTSALAPSGQKTLTDFTKSPSVNVLQGDATSLNLGEKFDVIVTDPPYADDVAYTELSDFYYVWLKRALSDVENNQLVPRFHANAFFKKIGAKYKEIEVQWKDFAKKEISAQAGRFYNPDKSNHYGLAERHFENLFARAFISMRNHLKDDGILVTYYAHTSLDAWANLLEAGWQRAKLQITKALPLTTESATSIVSRGKLSLDTSIVAVWHKTEQKGKVSITSLSPLINEKAEKAAEELRRHGYHGLDLLYGVMAAVLEEVTKYEGVYSMKGKLSVKELLEEHVYPATIRGIVSAVSKAVAGVPTVSSKYGLFYTAYKILFGDSKISANDSILLKFATGANPEELVKLNILKQPSRDKKEFVLYSPDVLIDEKKVKKGELPKEIELRRFLLDRGIDPTNPEVNNSVDALHLLEYYAYALPKSAFEEKLEKLMQKYSAEVEEAINIARLINAYYSEAYKLKKAIPGKGVEATDRKALTRSERELEEFFRKEGFIELILTRRLIEILRGGVLA